MRVYLDTCSLQRPLDDKTHARIALEAEAVLAILALCEHGSLTLISSDIISFVKSVRIRTHSDERLFWKSWSKRTRSLFSLMISVNGRKSLNTRASRRLMRSIWHQQRRPKPIFSAHVMTACTGVLKACHPLGSRSLRHWNLPRRLSNEFSAKYTAC